MQRSTLRRETTYLTWPWVGAASRDALAGLALLAASLAVYAIGWTQARDLPNGVALVGAERVLSGDVPYRDFWTMYAPGHFYLLALLFALFGTKASVAMVAGSVLLAGAAVMFYGLIRHMVGGVVPALFGASVFVLASLSTPYYLYPGSYPSAIVLLLAAFYLTSRYYAGKQTRLLVAAGLATGLAAVFKHDVSIYTAIAIGTGLVVETIIDSQFRASTVARRLGLYGAGFLVPTIPVVALLAAAGAGPDAFQALLVFPLTDFPIVRPEVYPGLGLRQFADALRASPAEVLTVFSTYVLFHVPLFVAIAGFGGVVLAFRRRLPGLTALGVMFLVAYALHFRAAHVQINTHVITMSAYGACIAAFLLDLVRREWRGEHHSRLAKAGPTAIRVLAAVWLVGLAAQPVQAWWNDAQRPSVAMPGARTEGTRLDAGWYAREVADLTAFLDARVPPDEPVYIGLHRHDAVVWNRVSVSFLLDRPTPTRYQELHPGIVDTAPVQREIVADLVGRRVGFLVLARVFDDPSIDEWKAYVTTRLPHVGSTVLDEFIRQAYRPTHQFGPYEVWERQG